MDVFKGSKQHPQFNACLNYLPGMQGMDAACEGYREAVEVLLAESTERSGTLDTLIYPIVFAWRHHLELRLKMIYLIGHALYEGEKGKIPAHHQLWPIWCDVRRYVIRHWPDGDKAELLALDAHIREISRVDKDSYVFRYTLDKQGANALPRDLTHIGLVEFGDVVRGIGATLEGIALGLDHALQLEHEARLEMRALELEYERELVAEMEAEYHAEMEAEYRADMDREYW